MYREYTTKAAIVFLSVLLVYLMPRVIALMSELVITTASDMIQAIVEGFK